MITDNLLGTLIIILLLIPVLIILMIWLYRFFKSFFDGFELLFSSLLKRPVFIYFHPFKKQLNKKQVSVLKQQFVFYNGLNSSQQSYFRHRVATFIKSKNFTGKDSFVITDEVEVLISATAIMLTFGFRNFKIKAIKEIIIYPTEYYSTYSDQYHKGEFNVNLNTLVLSWDNFLEGFRIQDDKLNLGIHEFAHAIHFNSIYQEDINSILFVDTFNQLRNMLESDRELKNRLIKSELIRDYAFVNDFELLAVIIETFIETPQEFRNQFPEIYNKTKQMLNFNFAGY